MTSIHCFVFLDLTHSSPGRRGILDTTCKNVKAVCTWGISCVIYWEAWTSVGQHLAGPRLCLQGQDGVQKSTHHPDCEWAGCHLWGLGVPLSQRRLHIPSSESPRELVSKAAWCLG